MAAPVIDTRKVYRTVADLLPAEGRDFTLGRRSYGEHLTVVITPTTPIGRAWVPFLKERLALVLAEDGVGVEAPDTGTGEQRIATAAQIAEAREADVSRQAAITAEQNDIPQHENERR